MKILMQMLISGVSMGFVYCLVAIEYTLIWNATGIVNFAHEKFITLGAFVFGCTMIKMFPNNYLLAVVGTMICMGAFGAVINILVLNPLRKLPYRIFSTMGLLVLAKLMIEGIRLIWGARTFYIPGFLTGSFRLGGLVISKANVCIIIVSIVLLILQMLFFTKTKSGRAMRCVAQNKQVATLMGVNVVRNMTLSVALSSMVCGLVGMLITPLFSISTTMATAVASKGFCAGVVGGFGTYAGAVAGGLFIGLIENLYLLVGPSKYKDIVAFGLMIFFLLIKPSGIMGKRSDNKTVLKAIWGQFSGKRGGEER